MNIESFTGAVYDIIQWYRWFGKH